MRSRVAATLLAGLAACAGGPRRTEPAVDPARYTTCQDPAAAAAWQQAQTALAAGDDAAALAALPQVVARCPDLVRAHLAWQDAARRVGGAAQQAMVDFYRGFATPGSPVAAYCQARLADTAYAQSNALQAIVAADPSFAWAHLSLARVTRRQGRFLAAYDMYGAAIANDPALHEARRERAQVLADLGRDGEAAVDYKAYVAARPDDAAAMRDYATLLLYRIGHATEALALLDQLAARSPGDLSLRMDRAAAAWRANRIRDSVDGYLAILRDEPTAVRAALNLGLLYYEVLARTDADRKRFWPRARAAFRWFLDGRAPQDGFEQFERTLGVPFRMERIAALLGPEPLQAVQFADLEWPNDGGSDGR